MAIDTPAKIAIVGAGPVGLEAALYARYLGYEVDVYERGRVVEHVLRRGHVRWFAPWDHCTTPLGRAALANQQSDWRAPRGGECMTGFELVERYFGPLAGCDLLADCIQEQCEVVGVGREAVWKGDFFEDERRIDVPFRLLLRQPDGGEQVALADVVIDCSGVFRTPNYLGGGGLPAPGELAAGPHIEYGLPDVTGVDAEHYRGRRTLVVGAGYSAATTVVGLARPAADEPATRIVWVTRRGNPPDAVGPVPHVADDPYFERESLAQQANLLTVEKRSGVEHRPGTYVDAVEWNAAEQAFQIELGGRHAGHETFDRVIANVGHRPDRRLYEELQVLECPVTGGPLPWASYLRRLESSPRVAPGDRLAAIREMAQALLNPEPDFYVLGAKSFGRRGDFTLRAGHDQIRALFTIIGDRDTLDLYADHPPQQT